MSKHTKGPWKIGTPGPNGCYTIGTERGLMTAMIAHSICEPDQVEEAKANAALIAAAPDLLEALYGMLLHIREPESESEFQWPDHFRKQKDAFIAARAAIAKALGK